VNELHSVALSQKEIKRISNLIGLYKKRTKVVATALGNSQAIMVNEAVTKAASPNASTIRITIESEMKVVRSSNWSRKLLENHQILDLESIEDFIKNTRIIIISYSPK
jgi:hypothetical protein